MHNKSILSQLYKRYDMIWYDIWNLNLNWSKIIKRNYIDMYFKKTATTATNIYVY